MNRWRVLFLALATACAEATDMTTGTEAGTSCSNAWYRMIEAKVPTGDNQGHGPDIGSDEWQSVIEFKLGIRNQPDTPDRNTQAWCQYIDKIVRGDKAPTGIAAEKD